MAVEYECCETGFFVRIVAVTLLVLFAGLMSCFRSMRLVDLEVLAESGAPTRRKHACRTLIDPAILRRQLMYKIFVFSENHFAESGAATRRKQACRTLIDPAILRRQLMYKTFVFSENHFAESGAPTRRKHACRTLIDPAGFERTVKALPIFLGSLVTAWGDILISVTLILLFGEIIPQAVCSRHGLAIGAKLSTLVQILVWICFPVAYPISKVLDFLLGEGNGVPFRRTELKTLIDLHGNEAGKRGELTRDETKIITGALELSEKTARDAMTPISETFAIDINAKLDSSLMGIILEEGFSRVPVYCQHPTNIIGILLVKNLLTILPEEEVPVKNVYIPRIPRVFGTTPLYNILNEFKKGHSHVAVVIRQQSETEHATEERDVKVDIEDESHLEEKCLKSKRSLKKKNSLSHDANLHKGEFEAIGIITLEDVLEELLQGEIYDETDYLLRLTTKVPRGYS